MAVITCTSRVLNVVSVVSDVVIDNKSMVCGTAKAGHAPTVHFMSQQQLPGYQPRPRCERSEQRSASGASWCGWRLAGLGVASSRVARLAKPWKRGSLPAGKPTPHTSSLISKRLTDKTAIDAKRFTGRMAMPAPMA
jgi:hypothetical protein